MRVLLFAVPAIFPLSVALADGEQPNMHRFYLEHAIVDSLKETSDQYSKVAGAFLQSAPKAAYSLGEFWWDWAVRDCSAYLHQYGADLAKSSVGKDQKKMLEMGERARDHCVEAFIFEHWDDINTSIANKAKNFPKDNEPLPGN
jgi:hypothetical protein